MDTHNAQDRAGLAVPIGLIAAGAMLFIATLTIAYFVLVRPSMKGIGFESPGWVTAVADEASDFTVMHQTNGVFEGRRHEADARDASGLRITVTRVADGTPVAFEPDDSFRMSVGATQRVTVGRFHAEVAGDYKVEATGSSKPIVLFVTQWSTSVSPITVGALGMLQLVVVALVWMGVSRIAKRRRATAAPSSVAMNRS